MFSAVGKAVSRGWWAMLLAWIIATVWITRAAPPLDSVTTEGPGIELPPEYDSSQAAKLISEAFRQESSRLTVIFRRPVPLERADHLSFDNALVDIQKLGDRELPGSHRRENVVSFVVSRLTDPYLASRLTSTDGTMAAIVIALRTQFVDVKTHAFISDVGKYLDGFVAAHRDRQVSYYITDSAAIGCDYETEADRSLKRTQLVTVTLVVVILLLMYRSLLGPAVTLATVVLSMHVATSLMALIGKYWMEVPKLVPVYMMVIIYGSVTDYCMFIIGRFREELARGHSRFEATRIAVSRVGAATAASAATTIAGLAMMAFADFEIFRATGPILGVGLAVGLLASVTFTPALIVLFGRHLFWPARNITTVSVENTASGRFWNRLAGIVVRRPGLILVVVVGFFLPFAITGLAAAPSYDIFEELPSTAASVKGNRVIREKFPKNSRPEQITIVLRVPPTKGEGPSARPSDFFQTYPGLLVVDRMADCITKAYGRDLIEVRSITHPMGRRAPVIEEFFENPTDFFVNVKMRAVLGGAFPRYVATLKDGSSVTRISVVLEHEGFSEKALSIAKQIRFTIMPALQAGGAGDAEVHVGGVSGHMYDLTKVTKKDLRRLRWMVLGVLYVILAIMLRSALSPIYLLATMVLNYFAALGILQLIFVNGLGYEGLDWKVEFFLFVLLVAIGVDYNIYIMSRLAEEVRRRPFRQALHHAVVFTGGIITSCGIIMAGTFASMMGSTLAIMVEIGAAMAVGVLLDTFLVRPLLVPSITLLVEKAKERLRGVPPA